MAGAFVGPQMVPSRDPQKLHLAEDHAEILINLELPFGELIAALS